MKFEDLTPEQIEKAKVCKALEEILALAKEEGYELSDDELGDVAETGIIACALTLTALGDSDCSQRVFITAKYAIYLRELWNDKSAGRRLAMRPPVGRWQGERAPTP